MYDPVIGRFISADPTVPYPFDPQSLNRYSYYRNNPLIYVDPSGHEDINIRVYVGDIVNDAFFDERAYINTHGHWGSDRNPEEHPEPWAGKSPGHIQSINKGLAYALVGVSISLATGNPEGAKIGGKIGITQAGENCLKCHPDNESDNEKDNPPQKPNNLNVNKGDPPGNINDGFDYGAYQGEGAIGGGPGGAFAGGYGEDSEVG